MGTTHEFGVYDLSGRDTVVVSGRWCNIMKAFHSCMYTIDRHRMAWATPTRTPLGPWVASHLRPGRHTLSIILTVKSHARRGADCCVCEPTPPSRYLARHRDLQCTQHASSSAAPAIIQQPYDPSCPHPWVLHHAARSLLYLHVDSTNAFLAHVDHTLSPASTK